MYTDFFKLKEKPFKLTASPSVFHENNGISHAYQTLIEAIRSDQKLILLTGETGTGKTLCAQKLMADLEFDQRYCCVTIPFTSLPFDEMLGYICTELNLNFGLGQNDDKLEILGRFLTHGHSPIQSVVILLDEAQNLSLDVFAGLVELLELGLTTKRDIQIVTIARNESDLNLHHAHMAEFSRHLSTKCQIQPLTFDETLSYIKFQLDTAGASYSGFFTEEAAAKVFDLTQGRARSINVLCDHVLNNAAKEGVTIISAVHVNDAHHQQKFDDTTEINSSLVSDALRRYVNENEPVTQEHDQELILDEAPVLEDDVDEPTSDQFHSSQESEMLYPDTQEPFISDPDLSDATFEHHTKPLIDELSVLEETHPIKPKSHEIFLPIDKPMNREDVSRHHLNRSNNGSIFSKSIWAVLSLLLIAGLFYQFNQQKIMSYLGGQKTTQVSDQIQEVVVEEPIIPTADQPAADQKNDTVYLSDQKLQSSENKIVIQKKPLEEDNGVQKIITQGKTIPTPEILPAETIVEIIPPPTIIQEMPDQIINNLINKAEFEISQLQLTAPKDQNALASYKSILEIDPENEQAIQGIKSLKQMFIDWADSNVSKNEFDRARNYYRKALIIDPQDQKTLKKLDELDRQLGNTDSENSNEKNTGLLGLSEEGNIQDLIMLLDKGAFPDTQDQKGNTPLMLATDRGHQDVVQTLLSAGADPDFKNKIGDTALMNAVWNNQTEIIDLLINKNANINAANKRGWTALMYAAVHGHSQLLKKLIDAGADLESSTDDQKTALSIAAHNGQHEIVKQLLQRGANINSIDFTGWTPLMSAAWNGFEPIVVMLLEHGADKSIATTEGHNAFELASEQRHYSVMNLLK